MKFSSVRVTQNPVNICAHINSLKPLQRLKSILTRIKYSLQSFGERLAVEEKLFVRKATGLVREIGAVTAIIIVIANTVGLGWQKRVFQFTGIAPLPENQFLAGIPPMAMAFILGGIAILLSVLAIAILTAAMPRSGGGYVAISRIIGPFWGFAGAWLEFFSIAWSFGIIAVAVFEGIYGIIGPVVFGPSFLASYPVDYLLLAGGVVLVIVFTIIGTFGVKMTGLLLQAMFWVPAVLTFYVFGLIGSATGTSVADGMRNIFGSGVAPANYVTAALNPPTSGVTFDPITSHLAPSYWGAVGTALIGAYFAYIGYAASTFVAGEVKEANRNLPKTLLAASVIIIALYVSVSLLASRAITGLAATSDGRFSLLSAWSYLSYGCSTGTPTSCLDAAGLPPVKLWTTTVAGLSASGLGLGSANLLLFLFGVLWIANDIPPFILTASRILFAMSFDRVLPAAFANVNDRFHSPINAVIATGVVGIIGCLSESTIFDGGGSLNGGGNKFLSAILGSGGGVELTDLFDAAFFTLFTFALFVLPLRASKKGTKLGEFNPTCRPVGPMVHYSFGPPRRADILLLQEDRACQLRYHIHANTPRVTL
ncbi:APC family permease [Candidatus Bathyarchaeota archaeon]|nr:MAG: APC family permease [Candidatus Bathyarchaeota archaeon]